MTDTPVNLHDPITEICERLGLEYKLVTRLDIRPLDTTVEVLKKDETGHPYVDIDGDAATDILSFKTLS